MHVLRVFLLVSVPGPPPSSAPAARRRRREVGRPLSSRPVYLVYLPYRPAAHSGAFFGALPADGAVDAPNLRRRRFFSTFGGGCAHRRCSSRQCRHRQPCHRACIGVVLWARRALPRELLSADCHVPWPGLARSGRGVPRRGRQFLCSLPPAPMDSRQLHRAPGRNGCAVFGFIYRSRRCCRCDSVAAVCAAAVPWKVSSPAICLCRRRWAVSHSPRWCSGVLLAVFRCGSHIGLHNFRTSLVGLSKRVLF